MSHLLELLGQGLEHELCDMLDRYYWSPSTQSLEQLQEDCRTQPDRPELHLKLGLAYMRALQYKEAVVHLRTACKKSPDYLEARLALAAVYEESGKTEKALDELKIANQVKCGEVPILFAIGFCCEKLENIQKAAEYYRDAIAVEPSFIPARQRLAAVSIFTGDINEAIEQYEAIFELDARQTHIHTALAQLNYRAGNYTKSIEHFESAIALGPENWSMMDDEVEALIADGAIREAMERLEQLIEQQGLCPELHIRAGDLYSKTDDDAALAHYRKALEIQPDYLEASVKIGTHHLIYGRWEEAAEAFHTAYEINDELLINYIGNGVAYEAMGKREDAINSFQLAEAIEPNSKLLLAEMAKLQLKSASADRFAASFESDEGMPVAEIDLDNDDLLHKQIDRHAEEIKQNPNFADIRYRYGVMLRSEGRLGEAIEQFKAAVEINPSYVQAIIKLGITQQELGLVDDAIETFKQAIDIKPEYVDLHYRLGLLYTDRRQFEEAVEHMETAAEGSPENKEVRAGLALALQNMGLMDRSAATWRSMWKLHHTSNKT